jgi:tripartite-type tricarboxylate transporter receptor subunit TctC
MREAMTTLLGRLILLGCLLASTGALAQSYPNRNVTIVVTSAPGGLTDVLTRAVGQRLSQAWNQTVVVENKGGAGHNLAANVMKAAAPDGYTLLSTENGMFTIQPSLHAQGKLTYAPTDFVPVANFAAIPMALLANPSLPAKSVRELIALAKEKPGSINYGTAGLGTAPHMGVLLLEGLAGVKLTAVHYRGVGPALNDVIAGHINMISMGPSVALPAYRAGKLAMLGVGSRKRVPQLADVPTVAESIPGYEASVSFGLHAPAAAPREIVTKINAEVQKILNDPAFRQQFFDRQLLEAMPGPPEQFAQYIQTESEKWGRVIRGAKLKID